MILKKGSFLLPFIVVLLSACHSPKPKDYKEWGVTGGSRENIRYSSLSEIDTNNIAQLQVAWTYYSEKQDSTRYGPMQCNPIIIDSVLYGVSPKLKLFAVDAATGMEKWSFNPADSMLNRNHTCCLYC